MISVYQTTAQPRPLPHLQRVWYLLLRAWCCEWVAEGHENVAKTRDVWIDEGHENVAKMRDVWIDEGLENVANCGTFGLVRVWSSN